MERSVLDRTATQGRNKTPTFSGEPLLSLRAPTSQQRVEAGRSPVDTGATPG